MNNVNSRDENWGHGGTTTASFVQIGDWAKVMNLTKLYAKTEKKVYVTIQFGHNDQKLGKIFFYARYQQKDNVLIYYQTGMDFMPTYKINLRNMIANVTANGGVPIIVSSLARRTFDKDNVTLTDTLEPWRDAALSVANAMGTCHIDLWAASTAYVKQIGKPAAMRLNLSKNDTTHLNYDGSIVFGRMVADLIYNGYTKEFGQDVFVSDKNLTNSIAKGIPSY